MDSAIFWAQIQKDAAHGTERQVVPFLCRDFERHIIERGAITGAWPNDIPTHGNGIMLSPG